MSSGTLFIVSAASGGGKTSLLKALMDQDPKVRLSISYSTRPMRPSEQDGVHYHFIDHDRFENMRANALFLEHAEVFGNFYGTSRVWIEQQLAQSVDVILEIDWQGAQQVRQQMPLAVSLFILPPSRAILQQRLEGRGQDQSDVIQQRMQAAVGEMVHYDEYDYLVINDDFNVALADIQAIIRAQRLKIHLQMERHVQIIQQLLS